MEETNINQSPNYNQQFLVGLKREIDGEKKRILIVNIASWIVFLFALITFLLWIGLGEKLSASFWFFSPWFLIPFLFFSFWLVVISGMTAYTFYQEKKIHFNDFTRINEERLPIFVVNAYKRNCGLGIFINWLGIISYIVVTLSLIVLFWLRNKTDPSLQIGNLQITINATFGSFNLEIILLFVTLGTFLVLHVLIFINTNRKKARLNSLFDLQQKIDRDDLRRYKRKVNIFCAAIFLIPLFLIVLIYWLFRKRIKR